MILFCNTYYEMFHRCESWSSCCHVLIFLFFLCLFCLFWCCTLWKSIKFIRKKRKEKKKTRTCMNGSAKCLLPSAEELSNVDLHTCTLLGSLLAKVENFSRVHLTWFIAWPTVDLENVLCCWMCNDAQVHCGIERRVHTHTHKHTHTHTICDLIINFHTLSYLPCHCVCLCVDLSFLVMSILSAHSCLS